MIRVACSGFPIPVSRYWSKFDSVEISDTEIALPGQGTIRRYKRESPDGFQFTMIAPKSISENGFRRIKENGETLAAVNEMAKTLGADSVVFTADPSFKPNKNTKAAIKSFIGFLPKDFPRPIFDLPSFKPAQILEAAGKHKVIAAYDPLQDVAPKGDGYVYLRLPGPAGHRSRYDEESVEKIAEHLKELGDVEGYCVFCNIDMNANGQQLIKLLAS